MKGRRKKQDDSQRVCTLGCTEGLSQSLFFSLSFFSFNYTTIKSLHTGTSEKRFILTEVTWSALSDKVKYPLTDTTYMLPICSFRLIFNRMTAYLTVSVNKNSYSFLRSFIQMKCQWCFIFYFLSLTVFIITASTLGEAKSDCFNHWSVTFCQLFQLFIHNLKLSQPFVHYYLPITVFQSFIHYFNLTILTVYQLLLSQLCQPCFHYL